MIEEIPDFPRNAAPREPRGERGLRLGPSVRAFILRDRLGKPPVGIHPLDIEIRVELGLRGLEDIQIVAEIIANPQRKIVGELDQR
ncbi:MAG TPA: hypothetical protein VGA51_21625, partial [Casimicrobiaceae bacterium]